MADTPRSPLWAGRLKERPSQAAMAFQSSFPVDSRMILEDIRGSVAHARMLGTQGIIPAEEAKALVEALLALGEEAAQGRLSLPEPGSPDLPEDVHSFVEQLLTERLGEAGKRLHTARSRNDQVALDTRLYCRGELGELRGLLLALIAGLLKIARAEADSVMPGYTHLQRAQPVTLGFHLAAWCFMLMRDLGRLRDASRRMDQCPLGSGALAGTGYPIDRQATAAELGFSAPCDNAMDAVADRDFVAEIAAALAILMGHLSRFSEELIIWSSAEFGFVELAEAWSTGSSIMPQKKNPDYAELVRGKSGRCLGNLSALLVMQKGLPLAYNKDMQEDKELLFDSIDTAKACLGVFAPMMASARFNRHRMRSAAAGGYANATDLADYLVRKGLAFRDAHHASASAVRLGIERGLSLEQLSLDDYRGISPLVGEDVYAAIGLEACVASRNSQGGPAPKALAAQLDTIEGFLAQAQDE